MIKDFETYISEGRLGRIMSASKNDEVRKEDDINIKPVDLGLSVLWGNKYFSDDGNEYFDIKKLQEIPYGWRQPTVDELEELFNNTTFNKESRVLTSNKNGEKISLNVCGFRITWKKEIVFPEISYILAGREKGEPKAIKFGTSLRPKGNIIASLTMSGNLWPVYLVKDKPVTEGRLGRIMSASNNDEVRKEDDIDNIKDFKPVYWEKRKLYVADRFYTERGRDLFTCDEIEEMEFHDGWRCMTFGEASDMELYTQKCVVNNDRTVSVEIYPLTVPNQKIILRLPLTQGKEYAEFWVGTKGTRTSFMNFKGIHYVFGENGPQLIHSAIGEKYKVLLVKDADGVTEDFL